jgi:hypothetical protein
MTRSLKVWTWADQLSLGTSSNLKPFLLSQGRLRDTGKNGCPAEIHHESTPLHPHKDILNTNTLLPKKQVRGAKAPTDKKVKKSETQKDPRTNFPAIAAFYNVVGKYPKLKLYDKVIEILGAHPDLKKMKKCHEEWLERGYNEFSLKWLTVWYVEGIPPQAFKVLNGGDNGGTKQGSDKSAKPTPTERAKQYNDYYGINSQARAG